jgi:hypothetical protein
MMRARGLLFLLGVRGIRGYFMMVSGMMQRLLVLTVVLV